jgi:uncharacterized protein YoxC
MNELSFVILALSVIVLTWALVKVNEKLDHAIKRLKKFEDLFSKIKKVKKI